MVSRQLNKDMKRSNVYLANYKMDLKICEANFISVKCVNRYLQEMKKDNIENNFRPLQET